MNEVLIIIKNIVLYGLEKVGLFYSDYRGYVYDNKDPKGLGRLQVNVPEVFGENVLDYWAWPSSNFSGNGYGAQCIPQTNDLVWVRFEKGNPRKPIWSYGYFGNGEKPDNLKDIKNFWFKTPGGNLIQFNDTTKEIRITQISGKEVLINDDIIKLLDGSLGGLTKTQELKSQLDKTNEVINIIVDALKNWPITPSDGGAALKTYFAAHLGIKEVGDYSKIENEKITHGV